jgi:hypothetical protein
VSRFGIKPLVSLNSSAKETHFDARFIPENGLYLFLARLRERVGRGDLVFCFLVDSLQTRKRPVFKRFWFGQQRPLQKEGAFCGDGQKLIPNLCFIKVGRVIPQYLG